jgi:AraC-like DNA-binding protein
LIEPLWVLNHGGGWSLRIECGASIVDPLEMARHETGRPIFNVELSRKQKPSRSLLQPWQSDRVLAHIEAHLDRPLRGAELAAVMGLSSSTFRRAFTLRFGLPPHAYIMRSRVERAKNLMLAEGKLSLAEIALICGLSDQSHLTRAFRRFVGDTPRTWRTRHLNQKQCLPSGLRAFRSAASEWFD